MKTSLANFNTICIVGNTGAGKTTMANLYKAQYPNSIIIEQDVIEYMTPSRFDILLRQLSNEEHGRIVLIAENYSLLRKKFTF